MMQVKRNLGSNIDLVMITGKQSLAELEESKWNGVGCRHFLVLLYQRRCAYISAVLMKEINAFSA